MSAHAATPLRFSPDMEVPAPDEAETNAALIETMGRISRTTLEHSGHAIRSVHAKSHGVLRGTLVSTPTCRPPSPRACSPAPASTRRSCASPRCPATSSTTASPPRAASR